MSGTQNLLWVLLGWTLAATSALGQSRSEELQTAPRQIDCIYRGPSGSYSRRYGMPLSQHRRVIARMEKFAWSHWKNKEPGCLLSHFRTAEGGTVDQSLFFENDENGSWRVRIERKEHRTNYGPPTHSFILRSTRFVYSIRRVERKRTADAFKPFSDADELRPGTYNLEGRSKDGELFIFWEPDDTSN